MCREVEVLVEDRLRRRVEGKGSLGRAGGFSTEFHAAEIEGADGELSSVNQFPVQGDGAVFFCFAGGYGLRSQRLVVDLLDALPQPEEIAHGQHRVLGKEVEERDHPACALLFEVVAQVGHDDDAVFRFFR